MGIHDGHRERMKKRFNEHGLENFDEVNVLELLLFYGLPRGDTNPLAHKLLDRFGSLAAVLDAPLEELLKVEGVGENTATLLRLVPQLSRRYMVSKSSFVGILDSVESIGEYIVPRFYGEKDEVIYIINLDAKLKVINSRCIARGQAETVGFSVRKAVEAALAANASAVILAHNHTSGIALPSREDKEATARLFEALRAVDIVLLDHIIVADDDFVSLAESGFFGDSEEN